MDEQRSEILAALERGDIDAKEAIRQLEQEPAVASQPNESDVEIPARLHNLWAVPVVMGAISLFGGYYLAVLGGWWWLAAGPLIAIGGLLFLLGLASIDSPWVHLRVRSDEAGAVSTFGLSLPLPLKPLIWMIKVSSDYVSALDRTAVDELLLSLEGASQVEGSLFIDVRQEDGQEQVRVYLG